MLCKRQRLLSHKVSVLNSTKRLVASIKEKMKHSVDLKDRVLCVFVKNNFFNNLYMILKFFKLNFIIKEERLLNGNLRLNKKNSFVFFTNMHLV